MKRENVAATNNNVNGGSKMKGLRGMKKKLVPALCGVGMMMSQMYIPTGEHHLHGLLEPVSRKVRATFTETEPN